MAAGRPFQCTLCWDRCALACCALKPMSPPQPLRRGQSSPSSCLRGTACPLFKHEPSLPATTISLPLLGSGSGTPLWGKYFGGQHGLGTALTPAHQPTCFSESVSGRQGQGRPRRRAGGFGGNPITEGRSLCLVQATGPARGFPTWPSVPNGCSRTFIQGFGPKPGVQERARDGGGTRLHLRGGAVPAL